MLGSYILIGCAKKDTHSLSEQQNNLSSKIGAWLDLQKTTVRDNKMAAGKKENIDLVKANLAFAFAGIEQLDKTTDVLTVPIKDAIIPAKQLDRNSSLALILLMDKNGRIRTGGVVYFQPASQRPQGYLPKNTLPNLLNKKGTVLNGTYKMLDATGKWLSQFEAKDGHLVAAGNVMQKQHSQAGQRTTTCYEWYLITTHFYTDGTTETTEQYLGNSCDGCSSADFASVCSEDPGSGGGGVGSGDEIIESEDEMEETSSQMPDPSTGINLSGTGIIPPVYNAHVRYAYDRDSRVVNSATGSKPTVIPVSQPFTDDNGDPAAVFYTIGLWNFSWYALLPGSFYATFTFDITHKYVFVGGTRLYTFADGFSKVIICA